MGTVNGNDIPSFQHMSVYAELSAFLVNDNSFAPCDCRLTHTTGYYRSMARLSSTAGKEAFCCSHTMDVIRRSLFPHKDYIFTCLSHLYSVISAKNYFPDGSPRRSSNAFGDCLFLCVGIDSLMQQCVKLLRIHTSYSFFLRDEPFAHHIHCDLYRCLGCALACASLQYIEFVVLDRKLQVLHIAVMGVKPIKDICKLFVDFRHFFLQIIQADRSPDACNYVFALSIGQVLAVVLALTGAGIPCKRYA